ncbi:unnamed protein product [Ranitomeya imitator]|uniref:Uncharacterized protein n=1 Tax=Ranitomeya imitator TaxID=111125 RepID=A0ABN9M9E3_9NEOB|nr:unnamed protein product [Ranitomeya imitator]
MLPLLLLSQIAPSSCDLGKIAIAGGKYDLTDGANVGSTVEYSCPGGRYPHPSRSRDCLCTGRWSDENVKAQCRDVQCPRPLIFENGDFYPWKVKYLVGDVLRFECWGGYQIFGHGNSTCQANGKWSGENAKCDNQEGDCPNPGVPIGGTKVGSSYKIGDKVTYKCQMGLQMFGSKERVCVENKRWSGAEPSCRCVIFILPTLVTFHSLSFVLLEALRRKGCTAVPLVRHDIWVILDTGDPALSSVDAFFLALGLLYDEPNSVDQAEKNLLALCQGQDDIEVYCQKFRKWSVLTQWNESALAALFRKGLSEALKDVMVGFPMPAGLNESLSLAIQIGRRLRERKSVHHLAVLPEVKPEPMQCDRTMTRVERQEYRRLNGLCFYCGDSTHAISDCPKRTKRSARSAVIGTVQSKFLLSITLICSLSSFSVMAFVDSGAALNLMDLDYAKRCGFFLEPLRCPIP